MEHKSNGRDGPESRSLDRNYIELHTKRQSQKLLWGRDFKLLGEK